VSDDDQIEQQVRDLLAEARHTEPIPPDVAARIDTALAELRGARTEDRPVATIDLAAARRRRNVRALLVAAAVVVVTGVGISRVDLGDTGADSADSSASSATADEAPDSSSGAGAEAGGSGRDDAGAPAKALGPPVRLRSDDFGRQVRRLDRSPLVYGSAADRAEVPKGGDDLMSERSSVSAQPDNGSGYSAWSSCEPSEWGPGRRLKARYDGKPGVLIYRPAEGDTRVVDLYLCGHDTPTRSITLPHR
jgi:hypothetical protein